MSKVIDFNMLHKLPDGYLIDDRMMDGERGNLLVTISPLAREVALRLDGYKSLEVKVLILWVPVVNSDDVVSTLETQGAKISIV